MLTESKFSQPMNIGSDRAVSVLDLYNMVSKIAGKRLNYVFDTSKPQGVRSRNADITLIKEKLGWQPEFSLEEGLKRTYTWIENEMKSSKRALY